MLHTHYRVAATEASAALRRGGHPWPGRVPRSRLDLTETGFAIEVEEEWENEGQTWYCREMMHADVSRDGITQVSVYCTGDWDAAQVTAATGLGGRPRQFSSAAERARVSVRKAIAAALRRLGTADPALARLLHDTVRTVRSAATNQTPAARSAGCSVPSVRQPGTAAPKSDPHPARRAWREAEDPLLAA